MLNLAKCLDTIEEDRPWKTILHLTHRPSLRRIVAFPSTSKAGMDHHRKFVMILGLLLGLLLSSCFAFHDVSQEGRGLQASPSASPRNSLSPVIMSSSNTTNSSGVPNSTVPISAAPVGTSVGSPVPSPTSNGLNSSNPSRYPTPASVTTNPMAAPPVSSPPVAAASDAPVASGPTLADYISNNDNFGGFYTAVIELGVSPLLQARLNSTDYFTTVLCPDNVAFSSMDPVLTAKFLTPEYALHFRNLIEFHALDGIDPISNISQAESLKLSMLNNETLIVTQDNVTERLDFFNQYNGSYSMSSASVDVVPLSNGALYGVNGVLLPDFVFLDIPSKAASLSSLSNFTEWVVNSGLDLSLLRQNDLTLLAPGNDAFAKAESPFLDYYGDPANSDELRALLLYHVVPKVIPSTLMETQVVTSLTSNEQIAIENSGDGTITFNGKTTIQQSDLFALNGIIHILDRILTPPDTAFPTPVPNPGSGPGTAAPGPSTPSGPTGPTVGGGSPTPAGTPSVGTPSQGSPAGGGNGPSPTSATLAATNHASCLLLVLAAFLSCS